MQSKRRPWNIGNTTVRNPYRLKDGLEVLVSSSLHGNIDKKEKEQDFAKLLNEKGIVSVKRIDENLGDASDVGRKRRAALSQLGFIVHKDAKKINKKYDQLINTITPNGKRLINSLSVSGVQECFLRGLLAYQIPSPIENNYEYKKFNPLVHLLGIMQELETQTGESHIYQSEIGLFVQLSDAEDNIKDIVSDIINFRLLKKTAKNKKRFDVDMYKKIAEERTVLKYGTLKDYADSNLRYLKATGLFSSKGKGIIFQEEKKKIIEYILIGYEIIEDDSLYLENLFNGASLPTDNINEALSIVEDLEERLKSKGIGVDIIIEKNDIKEINSLRHNLEEQLLEIKEQEFAKEQAILWKDIIAYMDIIIDKKKKINLPSTGDEISIPIEEFPAYFEWVLWRAFLAINHLAIPASKARKFKIDSDILPISHAAGGDADCVFIFNDFIILLEVTLTESSRQEAAEGEPVRRHVAKYTEEYNKKGIPVYGLFIANKIDSNTAETFRHGVWYNKSEDKLDLKIVPFTLKSFRDLFEGLFISGKTEPSHIIRLMEECIDKRPNYEAPLWKKNISITTEKYIKNLNSLDNHII